METSVSARRNGQRLHAVRQPTSGGITTPSLTANAREECARTVREGGIMMMMKDVVLASVGMIMAETAQAVLMIASKVAMSHGMSIVIFVFYSNALASIILYPASYFTERSQRPPLTVPILFGLFMLGLLGCLAQFSGYAGIYYSSATLGAAMLNLVPGFTFILAVIFRMEKIDWKSFNSIAKSIGFVVSITGAFIATLYKGIPLLKTDIPSNSPNELLIQQSNWVIGGALLVIDCVMASSWLIVQAAVIKKFPAALTMVFYYCFFVTVQSAIVCSVMERDLSAWSLKSNIRLGAVIYSGVFGSAFQVGISTWCLRQTGPVFVSMFKPLEIIIAVAINVIVLGDTFYLGSLVGSIVIVTGFYFVLWGKSKEEKMVEDTGVRILASSSQSVPLLQNNNEEV